MSNQQEQTRESWKYIIDANGNQPMGANVSNPLPRHLHRSSSCSHFGEDYLAIKLSFQVYPSAGKLHR